MHARYFLLLAAGPHSRGRHGVAAGYYVCVEAANRRQCRRQRCAQPRILRKTPCFTVVAATNNVRGRGRCKAATFRKNTIIHRHRHYASAQFVEKISGFLRVVSQFVEKNYGFLRVAAGTTTTVVAARPCLTMSRQRIQP
jgi:hypothetical protein